ncbi:MAG: L-threonylcarbamoyladenylate synthase [Gammaproteobacteria bacterium]|nr:L-threonylcarbamoyladenylate synthase [Gammaproteobacteria bacterium]
MTASREDIARAVECLRAGGVVAFPTETVYGLGADALNPQAVSRIYAIKRRPPNHPLIVHLPAASYLEQWARDIPRAAHQLAEKFWPGPLTLILPRARTVPDNVTGGQDSVGLRVPGHPVALALLQQFGGAVAAPSANRFGHVSPTTAQHVRDELGDEVDMILDGGACQVGLESTIVSLLDARPLILRPGAISQMQLSEALSIPVALGGADEKRLRAPGLLARHYAPATPLRIVARENLEQQIRALLAQNKRVAVIAYTQRAEPAQAHYYFLSPDPVSYAHDLYATLRAADAAQHDVLLLEAVPEDEVWLAVRDRLTRAAQAHQ